SRARPAPSAARSDISRERVTARASWTLATLAQAISNTTATKASTISRVSRTGPTIESRSLRTDAPVLALADGYSCARSPAARDRSSWACSDVTPGLSRPNPQKLGLPRVNQLWLGAEAIGRETSKIGRAHV